MTDYQRAETHANRISQQLSISLRLHLEGLSHELGETGIGISTNGHKEADSDIQIGEQVTDVQQLQTKLLLDCSLVHQSILATPNNARISHNHQKSSYKQKWGGHLELSA